VVLLSIFGTLITDNLTDNLNVPLINATIIFAAALAITFWAWYATEKTLSIHSIYTTRREAFTGWPSCSPLLLERLPGISWRKNSNSDTSSLP
jgi:uncharacterized membrane-anchored protein